MRFVAGRGAVAELLTGAVAELLLAGALQLRAIGKMLLAWALRQSCWPAGTQWQRGGPGHRNGEEAGRERRSGKEATGRGAMAE